MWQCLIGTMGKRGTDKKDDRGSAAFTAVVCATMTQGRTEQMNALAEPHTPEAIADSIGLWRASA